MSKELKLPSISKGSLVWKIINSTYDEFKELIETSDNVADAYAKFDLSLATNLELAKDVKRIMDMKIKNMKMAERKLREYMAMYMHEKGMKKIEGTKIKSITYQEPKVVKKILTIKQIKKGRVYVNVDELSKDDLVKMLEEKDVKTRVITEEVQEEKPETIRVIR